MNDRLELPPELDHLIEKREQDDRRTGSPQEAAVEPNLIEEASPTGGNGEERRSGLDRRGS
jgi:hypothetical protein